VTVLRADRVAVSKPADLSAYLQVDGEYVGHLPAEFTIVRDALTVLMPEAYGKD
jgi:diacylglycerol kinase family enzyme